MKLLLQHKIFVGYFLLTAVIGSMVTIILHERDRVQKIEDESVIIYQTRRNINTAHRYITMLASYGESVVSWNEDDRIAYNKYRLRTDSLLQILREQCKDFVQPMQIDTLRTLLANKEEHLLHIMQLFRKQDETDRLLLHCLPAITRQISQSRTITRKKKGIAGFFGVKETVQIPPNTSTLKSLNNEILSIQEEQQRNISIYTDSLRTYNRELNYKLRMLITSMDKQIECDMASREIQLKTSHECSMRIITWLVVSAITLLIISYIIIQRDTREKVKNQEQLESVVEKLRDNIKENHRLINSRRRIIQTIAHELRTPLTAIVGNAELIETDKKSERLCHLNSIRHSAIRMTSLLTNLMNYFRLDNGKEQVNPKPFQLKNIADTLHMEFVTQTEAKQLVFQVRNCEDEVVVGDKDLILRIGSNLLSNAVKFTDRGMISLSVFYQDGMFIMMVDDTGSGIAEEQQERIYYPFERLTNAATQDGFGLGLSIVRELVALMGGDLSLNSTPGKGSSFCVKLPLGRAEETIPDEDNTRTRQPLRDISVLVLDNDEVLLTMTRDMLARRKINCDTCCNVHELLDRMRSRNYDLLVTDLKMPDMNGYEVMELLRTSDIGNSRDIPIVVSTAMDKSAEAELLAAGFSGCLFKPFSSDEVALAITSSIGDTQQRQRIDLSALLAYGDKAEILERLITETKKEMEHFSKSYEKKDMAELDTLIHHLRSSWMLINADCPLRELYGLIHQSPIDEIVLKEKVQAILDKGEHIIRMAQKAKEGLWER
ncbi:hybrid sensor histidine kinase/response regulator [Parabacteroides timonensis]|uniref:hybrid sensor histidine kinase/response regulator n=1 Tax=Parabacteroides timonensis TaxID=1871013 RepID=UPI00094E5036|nr:hybrid sensor histidine kinase/response regulator [Parabacteroides timonensis]